MLIKQGEHLVYTDGSCNHVNGSKGGWGFVIPLDKGLLLGYGGAINCTNNQLEVLAAIMALNCFKGDNHIIVTTDSRYLCNGASKYLPKWVQNGYRSSNGSPIKNIPLWKRLNKMQNKHAPIWEWVKGHSGDYYNEIADDLALQGRLFAETYSGGKRETSMHNFSKINTHGKFFVKGQPKIYLEKK